MVRVPLHFHRTSNIIPLQLFTPSLGSALGPAAFKQDAHFYTPPDPSHSPIHPLLFLFPIVPPAVQFTPQLKPLCFGYFLPSLPVICHLNEKSPKYRIRMSFSHLFLSFSTSEWERETGVYGSLQGMSLRRKNIWRRSLWLQPGSLCVLYVALSTIILWNLTF